MDFGWRLTHDASWDSLTYANLMSSTTRTPCDARWPWSLDANGPAQGQGQTANRRSDDSRKKKIIIIIIRLSRRTAVYFYAIFSFFFALSKRLHCRWNGRRYAARLDIIMTIDNIWRLVNSESPLTGRDTSLRHCPIVTYVLRTFVFFIVYKNLYFEKKKQIWLKIRKLFTKQVEAIVDHFVIEAIFVRPRERNRTASLDNPLATLLLAIVRHYIFELLRHSVCGIEVIIGMQNCRGMCDEKFVGFSCQFRYDGIGSSRQEIFFAIVRGL